MTSRYTKLVPTSMRFAGKLSASPSSSSLELPVRCNPLWGDLIEPIPGQAACRCEDSTWHSRLAQRLFGDIACRALCYRLVFVTSSQCLLRLPQITLCLPAPNCAAPPGRPRRVRHPRQQSIEAPNLHGLASLSLSFCALACGNRPSNHPAVIRW